MFFSIIFGAGISSRWAESCEGFTMSHEAAGTMVSKPVYTPLPEQIQPARRCVLVVQDTRQPEAADLHERLQSAGAPLALLGLQGEAAWLGAEQACRDLQMLEAKLRDLLSWSPVGTRLYVCGDESFLWQIERLARSVGLLEEEIQLVKAGDRRELYCVHCSTLQSIGAEGETVCSHCGVHLLVRDHFSRRLGAYMGVCIDPDHPRGEGKA